MAMQPSPRAETVSPDFPSDRICIRTSIDVAELKIAFPAGPGTGTLL